MLAKALKNDGYEVDEAFDGKNGVEMCLHKSYDLVITDLLLPEQDGLQVTHILKEKFSSSIKIIAISGRNSNERLRDILTLSKDCGADMTFQKPFDLNMLIKAIRDLI